MLVTTYYFIFIVAWHLMTNNKFYDASNWDIKETIKNLLSKHLFTFNTQTIVWRKTEKSNVRRHFFICTSIICYITDKLLSYPWLKFAHLTLRCIVNFIMSNMNKIIIGICKQRYIREHENAVKGLARECTTRDGDVHRDC